MEEKYKILKQ